MADELHIPASDATVRVCMVDTTAIMRVNAKSFIEPVQPGHEFINIYVAAFLVEHGASGKKVMFDLGVRKDYWNLPAVLQKRLGFVIPDLRVDKDATEVLEESGVTLDEISSVIWSHYHWDHTGSMELFPPATELVVGPGFKASPALLPGFPENVNSPVDSRAFKDRTLTEIGFDDDSDLTIGGFRAHDFFGDGSFYLLDTPGHCLGHMCGLARTTGGRDSTFMLLGGDICHFPGDFRPSAKAPLPDPIPEGVLDRDDFFPTPCPCALFADHHPQMRTCGTNTFNPRTTPFYRISTDVTAAYADPQLSQKSVDKLVSFDASPSVLVCLSHDATALKHLPNLNDNPEDDLNDWKQRGYKQKIHWGWLNELPRNGKPGREPHVEGFWRDRKLWPEAKEELRKLGEKASSYSL
ncbi:hypothetical protein AYL99_08661 [Fonsecaea erecta]|uniref:Metallo-beta-lactamase domain-containing protein n=1 Tax=Fonsecaea erecta TaxID=1367422 RepID=A0A178ZFF5_9EURO|nr:hypothetical protein AYL99_08661 [Fonsecaea erecta]OAP57923.1 hypothetical protein AYL99_08661 [Fonsecaea erecta]